MAVTAIRQISSACRVTRPVATSSPVAATANSTEISESRSASPSWPLWTAIATSVTEGSPKCAATAAARAVAGPRPSAARIECHMIDMLSPRPPPQSPVSVPRAR